MSFYEEHKQGIIGSIIYHVIILLLLIFLGFFTPLPLPGEEGILVNFGNSENGYGNREPSPQRNNPEPVQSQPVQQEEQQQPTSRPVTTPPPTTTEAAEEVAMTQDYEKTAAIEAAEKKKKEEDAEKRKKQLAEERKRQEQIEKEKKRQEEQERIRQEELERQRQAELEKKRQEEAERKRKEEEQRKINEINSRAQGAFADSGSGSGGKGNSDGESQGKTFPGGNQGVPTGDPNAGAYGAGGSGSGNQGSGISYSLAGRDARLTPKPNYPGEDEGVVIVKITVDKYGNVTSAEPGVRGPGNMKTTLIDRAFWDAAKKAALKTKFNDDENAAAYQQGYISYRFTH
eukprot:gnl/Carplike_NY0171/657_a905_1177.p1 GENE.gnl/Carplike_NY0171/657_a905_1177~~gnl/Carplike_NY0171/657_a905_1177.p1  ORF type:complete len:344 (+),score=60.91 gnl/Carplike_NY0171/657_a905_1177:1108-2139(+)